ncbi:MAG: tetratricopeptide repeat protein [Planctomycetes bacterium]|jgi:tetratricopeptide (TPR) repeat protein|nr:tetratricopeptide repeat protein [Planctomycetota bacterium]MCL4730528.1 tetratricopeptide repeat protein [Planctomycetota bacterium]
MDGESEYLFRHALVRDAAYQLLPPRSRAVLHRAALEVLQSLLPGDAHALSLADHAARAALHLPEQAAELGRRELELLVRAAAYAEREFRNAEALAASQRIRNHAQATEAERIAALMQAGFVLRGMGHRTECTALWVEARARAQAAKDMGTALRAMGALADMDAEDGRIEQAEHAYREVIRAAEAAGKHALVGTAWGSLGSMYRNIGRMDEAEKAYNKAIEIARRHDTERAVGIRLGNLGLLLLDTGRPEQAEAAMREALRIARDAGNRRSEHLVLGNLAIVLDRLGRHDEAETALRACITMAEQIESWPLAAAARGNLAKHLLRRKRYTEAEQEFDLALPLLRRSGNRRHEGFALAGLADLHFRLGRLDESERVARQGLEIAHEIRNPHSAAALRGLLAVLRAARGDPDGARPDLETAVQDLLDQRDEPAALAIREDFNQACALARRWA